tara:strand:+ start:5007 stop:5324 length:318 start_codon:yes stop_codon:yes gene_type:complete
MWSLEVIGQVKRKWSKLVRVVKKSLYTLALKGMVTIILLLPGNHFVLDINVAVLVLNLQLGIGRVKNYGQAQEAQRRAHQKIDKENISIFVFNNLKNLNYAYGNL